MLDCITHTFCGGIQKMNESLQRQTVQTESTLCSFVNNNYLTTTLTMKVIEIALDLDIIKIVYGYIIQIKIFDQVFLVFVDD